MAMHVNQRKPEASILREFFQEQWEHLEQLLAGRRAQKNHQLIEENKLASVVESIVDGTDPRLRGVNRYHKQLRVSTRTLLDYTEQLVAKMPSALEVNQTSLLHDPLVRTFFEGREKMRRIFSQDAAIQVFFNAQENQYREEVFAVLFLGRKEANILGAEVRGDILLKDVMQTSVSFYGHRLAAPGAQEVDVRRSMTKILLESVIKHLREYITGLRYSLTDEEIADGLANPSKNINNPEVYLDMLSEQMNHPDQLLELQDDLLWVNSMGIRQQGGSQESSHMLRLCEVTVGGGLSRVVTLVRYPRCELLPMSPDNAFYAYC